MSITYKRKFKESYSNDAFLNKLHKFVLNYNVFWGMSLPNTFKRYSKIKAGIKSCNNKLCFYNSIKVAKDNNLKMVVGYVIDIDTYKKFMDFVPTEQFSQASINMTDHAWNINEKGEIVDFTYGSGKVSDYIYYGIEVPENILNSTAPEKDTLIRDKWFHDKIMKKHLNNIKNMLD